MLTKLMAPAGVLAVIAAAALTQTPSLPQPSSVFLEDLTWIEVRDAIAQGKTTVIIPTGGTEQNGPHMVLGKHNYLVKYKAGEIAAQLGNALVAPVIAYVPEGDISPPSGHMRFAGTISTPQDVFVKVLESAARSLRQHGFVDIAFIGDSGGNQQGQQLAADALNKEWAATNARVHHITAYYPGRGDDWVVSQGVSAADVGSHAGTHDTSSLMYLNPSMLRFDKMGPGKSGDGQGHVGNPAKATALFGKRILEMQIEDGARQIRELRVTSRRAQQQIVDPDFNVTVERPAYPQRGPMVAIDEAHSNFHTAGGQYKPFADLLTNDGYRVTASARKFDADVFAGIDVLIVANANARNFTDSAFTEPECDAVREWVRAGGALLLIADHAPYGTSAANLASRFGVTMGKGWVFEPTANSVTTQLTFSQTNGLLGAHPAVRGRDASEEVKSVRSFTGQSLAGPDEATVLLRLGPTAREAAHTTDLDAEAAARKTATPLGARSVPVAGRAQGLAMTFGKGRIVVLGEAAMFSAQVVTLPQADRQVTFKAGMNAPGNDDRQFALNVLHWLSGLLGK